MTSWNFRLVLPPSWLKTSISPRCRLCTATSNPDKYTFVDWLCDWFGTPFTPEIGTIMVPKPLEQRAVGLPHPPSGIYWNQIWIQILKPDFEFILKSNLTPQFEANFESRFWDKVLRSNMTPKFETILKSNLNPNLEIILKYNLNPHLEVSFWVQGRYKECLRLQYPDALTIKIEPWP